jgi:GNAT superfamily N-acetyltransferase
MTEGIWIKNDIRAATKKDVTQIADIRINSRKEWYQWILSQEYLDSLTQSDERIQKYRDMIESNAFIFLVSEKQWIITWFLYGGRWRDTDDDKSREIYAFYVDPRYQRGWVWSDLFDEFCRGSGSKSIYLRTLPGSKWESFYKKKGWRISWNRRIEIWGDTYDEVRYSFKISPE